MAIYAKNSDLMPEIIKSKQLGYPTPELSELLLKICKKASLKLYCEDPRDREDCVYEAFLALYTKWDKFNPELYDNPFAYYTSIVFNMFASTWKKLHPASKRKFTSIDAENINF